MSVDLNELCKQFNEGEINLLDVREEYEWDQCHVEGAYLFPLSVLEKGELPKQLPPDKPVYIHCMRGMRAQQAASYLKEHYQNLHVINNDFEKILQAGFPAST